MKDTIDNKLKKLTKENIIQIMYEALDLMQQYNSRSSFYCVATAMGYKVDENERNIK